MTGQFPTVPHHFGLIQDGNGMGTKSDDTYTVPVSNVVHRLIHDGKLGTKEELYAKFLTHRERLLKLFQSKQGEK